MERVHLILTGNVEIRFRSTLLPLKRDADWPDMGVSPYLAGNIRSSFSFSSVSLAQAGGEINYIASRPDLFI